MTTLTISKARFAALQARETGRESAVLLAPRGKKIKVGDAVQVKAGKTILATAVVCATAQLTFTPIALRRVLETMAGGEAGQSAKALLMAAEQGASQAAEHLEKLAAAAGYERWADVFDDQAKSATADDEPLALNRLAVAVTGLKAAG